MMTLLLAAEFGSAIFLGNENNGMQRRENSKHDHSDSNKKKFANLNAQMLHKSMSDKNLKWLNLERVDKKWSKSDKKAGQWRKDKSSSHKSHKSHKSHQNHMSHKSHKSHQSHKSHKSHKSHQSHKSHKSHKSHNGHKSHKRGQMKAKWEALQQENQRLAANLKSTQEALKAAQDQAADWKAKYDALAVKAAELEAIINKLNIIIADLKQKADAGVAWKAALDKAIIEIAEFKKALEMANQRLRYFAALQHKYKRDSHGNWSDKSKSHKSHKNSKSDKKVYTFVGQGQ